MLSCYKNQKAPQGAFFTPADLVRPVAVYPACSGLAPTLPSVNRVIP